MPLSHRSQAELGLFLSFFFVGFLVTAFASLVLAGALSVMISKTRREVWQQLAQRLDIW